MKTLVVDANNILRRALAAMYRSGLSADGVFTGATYVFVNCLSRHIKEERPTHVVVCWDGGRSTYRTAIYPQYKEARLDKPEEDEDERTPYTLTKEFLTLAGIHHVERKGVEADDLVAHYVREHRHYGKVVILSNDHDFLQLLGSSVEQVKVSSANAPTERWTSLRVEVEKGCPPSKLRYVMALVGEVGDNVPGIRGIGPKKAMARLTANDMDWERTLATFDPEQQAVARTALRLVDLYQPLPDLDLPLAPEFRPTQPTDLAFRDLLAYLDRYQMASVKQRLVAGTLWGETDGEVQRVQV